MKIILEGISSVPSTGWKHLSSRKQ